MKVSNVKNSKLTEAGKKITTVDDTIDAVEKKKTTEIVTENDESEIEKSLNRCLKKTRSGQVHNLLLEGEAGSGKTAIIESWAEEHNINLVKIITSNLDRTDLGGAIAPDLKNGIVQRFATVELDSLNEPRSVLFLDELNRAHPDINASLLTLILSHEIADPRNKNRVRKLNFLFTVAAINPYNPNYTTYQLDPALLGRFLRKKLNPGEKAGWLKFMKKEAAKHIKEGEANNQDDPEYLEELYTETAKLLAIAEHIIKSPDFEFSTAEDLDKSVEKGNGLETTKRNLTNLIFFSDGTKEDVLDLWNNYCSSLDKSMIKLVLNNYVEKEDKANEVLKKYAKNKKLGDEIKKAQEETFKLGAKGGNELAAALMSAFPDLNLN